MENIQCESIGTVVQEVTATVDAETYEATRSSVLKKIQKQLSWPGFRKGKVPFSFLQQRYPEEIQGEVRQTLVQKLLEQLKQEKHWDIAAVTKTDFTGNDHEQEMTVELEIAPDIQLPDYQHFPLEPENITISETEKNDFIERIRKQYATYEVVHRPIHPKDYVKLSYEGTVEGKPINEYPNVPPLWGKQTGTWEEADATDGLGIPEIVSGLDGLNVGDTKEITVHFPENFAAEALQKKQGTYRVSILEVREVKLPELNEEFLKKLQVKDVTELQSFAEKAIRRQKEQAYAVQQKHRITEFLVRSVTNDLPSTWIENSTKNVLQEMVNLLSSHGVTEQEREEQKAVLYEKAKAIAIDRIKLNLCFEKIYQKEQLKLENRDIEPVILQEAQARRIPPEKFVQKIRQDPALQNDIRTKAFQAKMINWLFQQLRPKANVS